MHAVCLLRAQHACGAGTVVVDSAVHVDSCGYLHSMAELGSFVPLVFGQQAMEDKGVGGHSSNHLSSIPSPQNTLAACEAA